MDLNVLERFALIELLLRQEDGSFTVPVEEMERLSHTHDGWCAVVLIRPEGMMFKAVSPERRAELLTMGVVEHD